MGEFKFHGSKRAGYDTQRLILEGTSQNPKRFVDVGGKIELSDEEAAELRKNYRLTAAGESDEAEGASSEKPETAAEQQRAQAATAGVAGGAGGASTTRTR